MRHEDRAEDSRLALAAAGRRLTNGGGAPAAINTGLGATQTPAAGRLKDAHGDTGQDALLSKFPGDAPACDQCGHITLRNGTCYKCLNCGNSMGCS